MLSGAVSASVERAVRVRVAACGATTVDDYWHRLKGSRAELQELIEVVVVPETWFSRDREAFAELTRVAREEWRPNRPAAVRRLLSVPCSTGDRKSTRLNSSHMPVSRMPSSA